MSKTIWTKFFWTDWLSDTGVRRCSLEARGLWMDMLCVAAQHVPIGYVAINGEGLSEADLARISGVAPTLVTTLISELERNGVFSRNREGVIYSRRMVKDSKKAAVVTPNLPNGKIKENGALAPSLLASSSWLIEFEKWYERYPHKVGRGAAEKSFLRARETASLESLSKGLEHYIATKPADRPWCNPATWLNQQRWLDRPADSGPAQASKENLERMWSRLLDAEARGEAWGSSNVKKSDIPADFIQRWQNARQSQQQEAAE